MLLNTIMYAILVTCTYTLNIDALVEGGHGPVHIEDVHPYVNINTIIC